MYFFIPLYNKFPDLRDEFRTKENLFCYSKEGSFPGEKNKLEKLLSLEFLATF